MVDQEVAAARQEIAGRLYRLERGLPRLSAREVAQEIHSLKGLAQAFNFRTLAALAHSLESELGAFGRGAVVTAYLDRMHDALSVGEGDHPQLVDLFFASIRARLTPA